ncbi:Translation machinery-associated protein 46 [Vanrija pseudolonga]|uniref:Translation machinery-associated protein 46 n=1 Tax=Vanrija pseudolonga TaxID=143232 RepID=A0AAF0YFS1_9TREE|nr:Translation machinery-associated protein 46 [Vanrija pseudolonga]
MPPKGKVKDDKTFGMKNKNKSSKVQKFVAQVAQQEAQAGKNKETLAKQKQAEERKRAKEAEENRKKMEAQLFKPAQIQKVPFGTGNKCKFSHDRNVERKIEKLNVYEDARAKDDKKADTMDTWDDDKLKDVVTQNGKKQRTTTDIVCKYFIQAIEDRKYGWFWICPNGGDSCMYRHALPPGFVLKKDKKDDKKEVISLEEFVEVERHKLKPPLTPVTPETFAAWKKNRLEKKAAEAEALEKAKAASRAAGKVTGMSGKDMFEFGGELYGDEEDADEEEWDISRMLARYREDETRQDDEEDGPSKGARGEDDGEEDEVEVVAEGVAAVAV